MPQYANLERNIIEMKRELSRISEERCRAALAGDEKEVIRSRINAAEKTLDNCSTLAKYVANFSSPVARQISQREAEARRTFQEVRITSDQRLFHEWVKKELIPLTRFAERLGHVAASAIKTQDAPGEFHRWIRI
ncbi:MAG: hypothetical protein ACHQ1H_09570 [Nitrososphaerales archaeon]